MEWGATPVALVLLYTRWLLLGASKEPSWWPLRLRTEGAVCYEEMSSDRLIKKGLFCHAHPSVKSTT